MEDKKADIFNSGKELFASKGFKNTNVSEIAKKAGIAVGTFYNYYPSKEKLFWDIFMNENMELKKSFESLELDDNPVIAVKQIMSLNFNGINSNPILKEWYNKDLFAKLEKEFCKEDRMQSIEKLLNSGIIELVKKWKIEGRIRQDLDDDLIVAIFKSIPYIDVHKEEIGVRHFPQIFDYITEFIMKGLTDC